MAIQHFPFHVVKDPTTITASTIGLALAPTLDGEGLSSQDDDTGPWLEHRVQVVTKPPTSTSGGLPNTGKGTGSDPAGLQDRRIPLTLALARWSLTGGSFAWLARRFSQGSPSPPGSPALPLHRRP